MALLAYLNRALIAKFIIPVYDKGATGATEAVAAAHAVEDRLTVLHSVFLNVHMVLVELSAALRILTRK